MQSQIRYEDTIEFVPPFKEGTVIKVYDGDTITVASKLYGDDGDDTIYRINVRLAGIDTPEMRSNDVEIKKAAHSSQQFLSDLLLHKTVTLKNTSNEKYSRLLADVYLGDVCVNKLMIEKGYAVEYYGGTKNH